MREFHFDDGGIRIGEMLPRQEGLLGALPTLRCTGLPDGGQCRDGCRRCLNLPGLTTYRDPVGRSDRPGRPCLQTRDARACRPDHAVPGDALGANPPGSEAAPLLEANEQLVIAAVQHQAAADTAAQALTEVSSTAELDALTQPPNRVLLLDRFSGAIANARRHATRLAVLFLDIDNFKLIDDNFGHAIGDAALRRVADCLSSAVRAGDTYGATVGMSSWSC